MPDKAPSNHKRLAFTFFDYDKRDRFRRGLAKVYPEIASYFNVEGNQDIVFVDVPFGDVSSVTNFYRMCDSGEGL